MYRVGARTEGCGGSRGRGDAGTRGPTFRPRFLARWTRRHGDAGDRPFDRGFWRDGRGDMGTRGTDLSTEVFGEMDAATRGTRGPTFRPRFWQDGRGDTGTDLSTEVLGRWTEVLGGGEAERGNSGDWRAQDGAAAAAGDAGTRGPTFRPRFLGRGEAKEATQASGVARMGPGLRVLACRWGGVEVCLWKLVTATR